MLRIQGFPDSYKIVLSYGKVKKQCGNSVAVPVIKAVAKNMIKALDLCEELTNEFPSVDKTPDVLKKRKYSKISIDFWEKHS